MIDLSLTRTGVIVRSESGIFTSSEPPPPRRIEEARECFRKCVETGLVLDPDSSLLDAKNEFHLARWRLGQLSDKDGAHSENAGPWPDVGM